MKISIHKSALGSFLASVNDLRMAPRQATAAASVADALRKAALAGIDVKGKTDEEVTKLVPAMVEADVPGAQIDMLEAGLRHHMATMPETATVRNTLAMLALGEAFGFDLLPAEKEDEGD